MGLELKLGGSLHRKNLSTALKTREGAARTHRRGTHGMRGRSQGRVWVPRTPLGSTVFKKPWGLWLLQAAGPLGLISEKSSHQEAGVPPGFYLQRCPSQWKMLELCQNRLRKKSESPREGPRPMGPSTVVSQLPGCRSASVTETPNHGKGSKAPGSPGITGWAGGLWTGRAPPVTAGGGAVSLSGCCWSRHVCALC